MAAERLNESEGYTSFGGSPTRQGNTPISTGVFSRFFSRFFARRAKPALAQQLEQPVETDPLTQKPLQTFIGTRDTGDAVINREVGSLYAGGLQKGIPLLIEQELNRKQRYREYEIMDEYPEIGAAFDIYADDSTQKSLKGERWEVKTDSNLLKKAVDDLFDELRMDDYLWDIIRNTCKYGDCFIELVPDLMNPEEGIKKIKILDPKFIFRIENHYGQLIGFAQQIPVKAQWNTGGYQGDTLTGAEFIMLDKDQIIHFRLANSDPAFYPYGKSIAALSRQTFRSLKLMEDAMLIYRLSRAPERRIFYVDVGNLSSSKAYDFIEKMKQAFKKEKYYSQTTGNIDGRYNPLAPDEDFWVPIAGSKSSTKIDTLPGAQNLGDVDDVQYFRDKLLASLKIPKDYIVEKDKSPERKANLAQLDTKFARVIVRVQRSIEIGLEALAARHLKIKGFPRTLIKQLRVNLPEPSDMYIKRRLDVDEQKARVVQAVLGLQLFPKEKIYKDYYNLTDDEIKDIEEKVEKENEEMMAAQQEQMAAMAPPGAPPGAPPPAPGPAPMDSAENMPPTAQPQQERVDTLNKLKVKLLKEGKTELAEKLENRINEILES
jgi:hypothetical protein